MPEFASLEQIRRHFPALARTHDGHPVAYFDGPGGTQVPRRVVAAMTEYLLQHNANTDWAFPTSQETDQALFEAKSAGRNTVRGTPADPSPTSLEPAIGTAHSRRNGPAE